MGTSLSVDGFRVSVCCLSGSEDVTCGATAAVRRFACLSALSIWIESFCSSHHEMRTKSLESTPTPTSFAHFRHHRDSFPFSSTSTPGFATKHHALAG